MKQFCIWDSVEILNIKNCSCKTYLLVLFFFSTRGCFLWIYCNNLVFSHGRSCVHVWGHGSSVACGARFEVNTVPWIYSWCVSNQFRRLIGDLLRMAIFDLFSPPWPVSLETINCWPLALRHLMETPCMSFLNDPPCINIASEPPGPGLKEEASDQ